MFTLWILIKPVLASLIPAVRTGKGMLGGLIDDILPALVAVVAVVAGVALLGSWWSEPPGPPMVLLSDVENKQRQAHIDALLTANTQLENTLEERNTRAVNLEARIVELEADQRKALNHATAQSGSHLFSDDSEWLRAKRQRAGTR